MKDQKFFITTLVITLVLVFGGVVLAMRSAGKQNNTNQTTLSQNAKLELAETNHDWGEIPINAGNVEKVFELNNTGTSPLMLTNFITSCMCTTVFVTTNDGESPTFGMHTKSSWSGTINPGESARVKVIFDPAFHGPQGKGQITRIIRFDTNDPTNSKVELTLTGNVI